MRPLRFAAVALALACTFLVHPHRVAARDERGATPLFGHGPLLRDYLYPEEALPLLEPSIRAAADLTGDAELVAYQSFYFHESFTMRQYLGRYVSILIEDDDVARAGIGRIRDLVDRFDLLYAHNVELTGGEPSGSGRLRIAFARTCGGGCGFVGSKGIELDPQSLDPQSAYGPDGPYDYGRHEMNHNFDRFSSYAMVGPDVGHQWTCLLDRYIRIYNRLGAGDVSPEDAIEADLEEDYLPYLTHPGATWAQCIRDGACGGLTFCTQAGVILRLAKEIGPAAMRRGINYLSAIIASRGLDAGAMTSLQRNDLMIEALSYGAEADLSCFYDPLDWPISTALRTQMAAAYGDAPGCGDADGDTYSRFEEDCDDASPTSNPGAAEGTNGVDDDCDRLTDEVDFTESGDFGPPLPLPVPAVVNGAISNALDADDFTLTLAATADIAFDLESLSTFRGWLFVREQGSAVWKTWVYVGAGDIGHLTVALGPGTWSFYIDRNVESTPGVYRLTVREANAPWPPPFAPPVAPGEVSSGFTLGAPAIPELVPPLSSPSARFWVSNVGWVGQVVPSLSATVPFHWQPGEGELRPNARYRVQYVDGTAPASPASPPSLTTALVEPCSNDLIDFGEQCDDGAQVPGDGCDGDCAAEECFACAGEPSSCSVIDACANGDSCCPAGCDWMGDTDCATPTPTSTQTPTETRTPTRTLTPTSTRTSTATRTATRTRTYTATPSETPTRTSTRTATSTRTPTATRTATPSPTDTGTRTATRTPTTSVTPTRTRTATRTLTPQPTATRTSTPLPTRTATPSPGRSPTRTVTRLPSPSACTGDCDGDGIVEASDIARIVGRMHRCGRRASGFCGSLLSCIRGDANGDGLLSAGELARAIAHATTACGGS